METSTIRETETIDYVYSREERVIINQSPLVILHLTSKNILNKKMDEGSGWSLDF